MAVDERDASLDTPTKPTRIDQLAQPSGTPLYLEVKKKEIDPDMVEANHTYLANKRLAVLKERFGLRVLFDEYICYEVKPETWVSVVRVVVEVYKGQQRKLVDLEWDMNHQDFMLKLPNGSLGALYEKDLKVIP